MRAGILVVVIVLVLGVCVSSESCSTDPYGEARLFNLYSLSDIEGCQSDVEGRVAAHGSVHFENYDVGLKNKVNEWYSLVASSTVDFTSGSVWKGGIIGSDVSNVINVGITADSEFHFSNDCCNDPECPYCVSTAEAPLPIDFDVTDSYLLELSLYWNSLPETAGVVVEYLYQSLTLTCGVDGFNHFKNIHLDGVTSLEIVCSETSTVVIDYTIDTVEASGMGITLTGIPGTHVIHHFCGSTLTVTGINLIGTVFAPWSDVFFPSGLITGPVFAGAYLGSGEIISEVSAAFNDECGKYGDGHAIIMNGAGSMGFEAEPQALFVQNDDGTATITGRARNGDIAFDVEVVLGGYSTDAPPDSPKEELKSSCYVSSGGSVDPATWVYYQEISGIMYGVEGSVYAGAVVTFTRKGPSAQVGEGANGKNQDNGLSFWFDFETYVQGAAPLPETGYGDFNLDSTVIQDGTCQGGQINLSPFDGCVPTMQDFTCCEYNYGSIVNAFCVEDSCPEIEGWTLVGSPSVSDCETCHCPTD